MRQVVLSNSPLSGNPAPRVEGSVPNTDACRAKVIGHKASLSARNVTPTWRLHGKVPMELEHRR